METLESLVTAARECGFTNLQWITQIARSAISLYPQGRGPELPFASRIGGMPGLPLSMRWPQYGGCSMEFIAQVDLESLPHSAIEDDMPRSGRLLFFYDQLERSTGGCDGDFQGSWSVVLVPEPVAREAIVTEWPADLPADSRFEACGLLAAVTLTLPHWDSVLIEDLELDQRQLTAYQDLLFRVTGDDPWVSRALLGGYPDQIQGDMTLDCAQAWLAVQNPEIDCAGSVYTAECRADSHEWRLLLQVPSIRAANMLWGDETGCLYYWIRNEDLRALRFDRTQLILQF